MLDASKDSHSDYFEHFLEKWKGAAKATERRCSQHPNGAYGRKYGRNLVQAKSTEEFIEDNGRILENLKTSGYFLHEPFHKEYYYHYKGSLTIPPCTDNVHWFITDEPVKISYLQLLEMEILIASYLNEKCEQATYADFRNYHVHVNRPIQKHKGQDMLHCDESDYTWRGQN